MDFDYHENKLIQKLNERQKGIYVTVKSRLVGGVLEYSKMHLRHYTDHGCQHSKNIIIQISSMIPDYVLRDMEPYEVLILMCSAWLHDIGLLAEKNEKGNNLSDKEIRERHHELSKFVIKKLHSKLGIDDVGLADIISNICYCHRRKTNIDKFMKEIDRLQTEKVRQRFLVAILRLADAFDTTSMRTLEWYESIWAPSKISRVHLEACKLIQAVTYEIEDRSIVIRAHFKNEEERKILQWKIVSLFEEFESVKEILIKNGLPYLHIRQEVKDLRTENEEESIEKPILTKENMPTELILNELEQYEELHAQRKEYIFAADCCWRSYLLLLEQNKKECALIYINRAIENIEAATGCHPDRRYFLRILYKYYLILQKKLEGLNLDKEEKSFFKDISFIQRSLDTIEKKYLAGCHTPYGFKLLFEMGRSPLRDGIKVAWNDFKEKNIDKKDGSLDNHCCLCTANYVIISTLINETIKTERSVKWLLNQKNSEWRTKNDQERGFDYTSSCLTALFEWYYPHYENVPEILEMIKILLKNRSNWGDLREIRYINALVDIIFPLGLLSIRFPSLDEDIHKAIEKEIVSFLGDFQKASKNDQEVGLRGILLFDKITDENMRRKMQELAIETVDRIKYDPNWDRKTGMWGAGALNRTGNRIYNWLHFWELTLKTNEDGGG
jgi:hypothetical protein